MFAGLQALLSHWIMRSLRGRRNHDGVDALIRQQHPIVDRCRGGLGLRRDLLQTVLFDFGNVEFLHKWAYRAGFRTNPAAPACPNNAYIDPLQGSSVTRGD